MLVIISLVLMGIVDIGINFMNGSLVIGTDGDWINFWGSFLGSLIGVAGAVLIAYWTTNEQINESRSQLDKQLEASKKNELNNAIELNDVAALSKMIKSTEEILDGLRELNISYEKIAFDIGTIDEKKQAKENILENKDRITLYKAGMKTELSVVIGEIGDVRKDWEALSGQLLMVYGDTMMLEQGVKLDKLMVDHFKLAINVMSNFEEKLIKCYKNYVK